jgi:type III secretion protein V
MVWRRQQSGGVTETHKEGALVEEQPTAEAQDTTEQGQLQLNPLMLYFSPEFKKTQRLAKLREIVIEVGKMIVSDLGVSVPQILIRYHEGFKAEDYQLLVFEIPTVTSSMKWGRILVADSNQTTLSLIDWGHKEDNDLTFGEKNLGFWVDEKLVETCSKHQIRYLTYEQFLLLHLKFHINKHISDFLGIQEVKVILDKMTDYQDLIKELLRMIPLNKIAEVFQRLVAESISIRNFKLILDTMLEWAQRERDTVIITEHVRRALGRYIAYKFSKGSYLFPCIILSHDLEDVIRDSIRYSDNGSYLALDPRISDKIVTTTRHILDNAPDVTNPIVLCHFDIRRYVRSITEKEFAFLPVLSFQELEGNAQFNSLGVINLE